MSVRTQLVTHVQACVASRLAPLRSKARRGTTVRFGCALVAASVGAVACSSSTGGGSGAQPEADGGSGDGSSTVVSGTRDAGTAGDAAIESGIANEAGASPSAEGGAGIADGSSSIADASSMGDSRLVEPDAGVVSDAGVKEAGSREGGVPAGSCGATPNALPFDCKLAWGVNGESPTSFDYVQFISNWAGYNIQANGTFSSCDQCGWLKSTMADATQVPALIAYIIGYYGHALGYADGNQNPNGPNLTNSMGPVLLGVDNASCPSGTICSTNLVVKAYAWYAQQVYAAYKKPILWLMEGDFIQYSVEGSSSGLSYDQLGQLAAQITLAVKCNDPSAIVAWNYSTWISTTERDSYFAAVNSNVATLGTSYEMVFTTGVGSSANAGTGTTWEQLYTAAGNKPIYSDESFGLSAAGDSWANQSAATIDARIAGHVAAVNITTATPAYLETNLTTTLAPSALNMTCF
jgi:hypothetical protein